MFNSIAKVINVIDKIKVLRRIFATYRSEYFIIFLKSRYVLRSVKKND